MRSFVAKILFVLILSGSATAATCKKDGDCTDSFGPGSFCLNGKCKFGDGTEFAGCDTNHTCNSPLVCYHNSCTKRTGDGVGCGQCKPNTNDCGDGKECRYFSGPGDECYKCADRKPWCGQCKPGSGSKDCWSGRTCINEANASPGGCNYCGYPNKWHASCTSDDNCKSPSSDRSLRCIGGKCVPGDGSDWAVCDGSHGCNPGLECYQGNCRPAGTGDESTGKCISFHSACSISALSFKKCCGDLKCQTNKLSDTNEQWCA